MGLKARVNTVHSRLSHLSPGDITACEFLFLVSFAIWMVFQLLETALIGDIISVHLMQVVRFSCIALLFISELLGGRYDRRTLVWLCLAWLFCIGMINSGQMYLIDWILFSFCARNVRMDKILQVAFWVSSIVCVGIILCSLIGLIPNVLWMAGDRPRYLLGFTYMLFPSMIAFNVTCIVVLLKQDRFSLVHALCLFVANFAIYLATDSRLSFYLAIAIIVLGLMGSQRKRQSLASASILLSRMAHAPITRIVAYAAFPVCALVMLLLTIMYSPDNAIMQALNSILGQRLELGNSVFHGYGLTLFGQEITQTGSALGADGTVTSMGSYNYIDSLYVKLFIQVGIVPAIIFIAGFTWLSIWAYNERKWYLLAMLLILALHLTIDDLSFFLRYNILLLYLSMPLTYRHDMSNEDRGEGV